MNAWKSVYEPKINLESLGFEPPPPKKPFFNWKNVIFNANFYTEGLRGRGFWQYVEVLQSLYFWGEKVPYLLFYAETRNKHLKFGQKLKKTKRIQWDSNPQWHNSLVDLTILPLELLRQTNEMLIISFTNAA